MSIDRRRFRCPSVARPMITGDGYLARLAPLDAPLNKARLHLLAKASQRWGNGIVEVTRRGNLQCRGFPRREDGAFQSVLGTLPGQSGSRFPISLDPMGLLQPALEPLMRALYAELHQRLSRDHSVQRAAPKISVVISAGGGVGYDTLAADLKLHLEAAPDGPYIYVGLGRSLTPGDVRWQGRTQCLRAAVDACLALLRAIGDEGPLARAWALPCERIPRLKLTSASPALVNAYRVGDTLDRPVPARLWAVPQGRLEAVSLEALGDLCQRLGAAAWPLPGRRLLIAGQRVREADGPLRAIGMIDAPDHPLPYIDLCAGLSCSRSGLDTHGTARRLAALLAVLPRPISVHLSGCPKRCARDTPALLTIAGDGHGGAIQVIVNGRPGDPALFECVNSDALWAQLPQWTARVADAPDRCQQPAHWRACWQALADKVD